MDIMNAQNGRVLLGIKDNGIGIKKEYQSKVFHKFYRVPTGDIHDVKGFGLGLFYIKNICKAHGWQVKLESEEGKGTTIFIEMPQVKQVSKTTWDWLKNSWSRFATS